MFRKYFINVRLCLDLECFTASICRIMSHCRIQTAILLLETSPHFLNVLVEGNPELPNELSYKEVRPKYTWNSPCEMFITYTMLITYLFFRL